MPHPLAPSALGGGIKREIPRGRIKQSPFFVLGEVRVRIEKPLPKKRGGDKSLLPLQDYIFLR